jgi:hypothetical protein
LLGEFRAGYQAADSAGGRNGGLTRVSAVIGAVVGVSSVEFAGGTVRRPGKTGRQLADLESIWQYTAPGTAGDLYYAYQILRYFQPSGR